MKAMAFTAADERPEGTRTVVARGQRAAAARERVATVAARVGILLALVLLIIASAAISPHFLGVGNLLNVARQVALVGIVGVGMTFVILTAGIDLSVGSIVGVVAVITAQLLLDGTAVPLVVLIALLIGAAAGAINGLGIVAGGVPPFVMTLGGLVMGRGLAMTLANGQPVNTGSAAASFTWLGTGTMLGVPVPVWVFAAVTICAWVVLRMTAFGRAVYAVGDSREAARLSGINVGLVELGVYVISGVLAALTAMIFVSRLTVGAPTDGTGLELLAIAIVVIGGTSLFGGEGGVWGTVIGAGIIAVLANLMNLMGISPFSQQMVQGAIVVAAVLLERLQHRGRKS
jgi:ribose transport system permease protein